MKSVKLKRVANIYDGIHETPNYKDSGIKFVSVEDINNLYNSNKYISSSDYNNLYKIKPQFNDILMTRIGDIGTPAICNKEEPLAYYVSLALIKPKEINTDYLYFALQSQLFKKESYRRTIHVAFPKKINLSEIGECLIPLLDLDKQKQVATFLNLYYKKIELFKEKLRLLKLRKNGFLQKLFRNEYSNTYRLSDILKERAIYSSDKQRYVHATLSKDGVAPKTERYNRDFLVKDEEKKYKITYLNDICYNPANLKFGVICLNTYGTLIFSPIYVTFEINTNLADITYISHFLTYNETIQKLRKYEEGTVYERMAVSSDDFLKLKISLPVLAEQKEISKKLSCYDKEIKLITNKINLLERYKQGLLQKMFI